MPIPLKLSPGRIFTSLRHRRGFGVHSPFAFRFITETLHCRWRYYAYSKLQTGRERLIFRIMAHFDCRLKAFGDGKEKFQRIHSLAVGSAPRRPGVILAIGSGVSASETHEIQALLSGCAGFICSSKQTARKLLGNVSRGMSFENLHGLTVFVADRRLPRQHYYVSF